ncbi:uncharacterized protein LOC122089100 isoform X2 [Macadamia integrifolia]|uniref:uncharacterized protein LOC122089100 isoform X2 n=1 Tax=Macadamia integrifolia TaxID=60698 RepID=UPI001C500B11|nr:uncharacterized protein LOC122089100 isoform X2 [Macadamia integrifolia]
MLIAAAILTHGVSLLPPKPIWQYVRSTSSFSDPHRSFPKEGRKSILHLFNCSGTLPIRSFQPRASENSDASTSGNTPHGQDAATDEVLEDWKTETSSTGSSFLAKLAIALGIAATITVISVGFKWPTLGSSLSAPSLVDSASTSVPVAPVGFTFKVFRQRVVLPEYAPGWIYFWLLMAAGCGLFISEEALNIWVGISLARMLCLDGTSKSFAESFSRNAPYIISTVLWVYWGVCISDMVPFYLGKLFRKSGASDDICSKVGISKEKALNITQVVQRYGNLIGFVERFSLGVRNPTSFLAGALGISSECFFAGVCFGGLITLPIQLGIGFLLRERPVMAIASVATAVGIWTVFPYTMAALTALFLFLRQRYFSQPGSDFDQFRNPQQNMGN